MIVSILEQSMQICEFTGQDCVGTFRLLCVVTRELKVWERRGIKKPHMAQPWKRRHMRCVCARVYLQVRRRCMRMLKKGFWERIIFTKWRKKVLINMDQKINIVRIINYFSYKHSSQSRVKLIRLHRGFLFSWYTLAFCGRGDAGQHGGRDGQMMRTMSRVLYDVSCAERQTFLSYFDDRKRMQIVTDRRCRIRQHEKKMFKIIAVGAPAR